MKTTLLNIVAGSIMLTSIAISGETILEKAETIKTKTNVTKDPAITLIKNEILNPVIKQSQRHNKFSRSFRPQSMTYDLVEITEKATKDTRFFNVVSKYMSHSYKKKSSKEIVTPMHEIKYLIASNKFFIKQGNEWVTKQDHKFLRLLPKSAITTKAIVKTTN